MRDRRTTRTIRELRRKLAFAKEMAECHDHGWEAVKKYIYALAEAYGDNNPTARVETATAAYCTSPARGPSWSSTSAGARLSSAGQTGARLATRSGLGSRYLA